MGAVVSHEAIYTWICAMARTTLREHGIMLRSRRTRRRPRRSLGGRKAPIIGMISIDERPEEATDRRVAGHWEGDLIIGAHGRSAAITLAGAHHPVRDDPGPAQGQGLRRGVRRADRPRQRAARSDERHPDLGPG